MKQGFASNSTHHAGVIQAGSHNMMVAEPTIMVVPSADGLTAFVIETPRQIMKNRFSN